MNTENHNSRAIAIKKGTDITRFADGAGIDDVMSARTNGAVSYYLGDHLGSVRQMINGSGAIANQYVYGVFGELALANENVFNIYQYTGRESASNGLYYYRARYYQAGVGRFVSQDPVWGSETEIHRYVYVKNNAINNVDPMGLFSVLVHGNYCGWGNKNPRGTPPGAQVKPEDCVDRACQAHDNCYERGGLAWLALYSPWEVRSYRRQECDNRLCVFALSCPKGCQSAEDIKKQIKKQFCH